MPKIFTNEKTARGTDRKIIYIKSGEGKALKAKAKQAAMSDFNEDIRREKMYDTGVKPFKHRRNTEDYWLAFERAAILRFNI